MARKSSLAANIAKPESEDAWEDVIVSQSVIQQASPPASISGRSPRKRRSAKTVFVAGSSRRQSSAPPNKRTPKTITPPLPLPAVPLPEKKLERDVVPKAAVERVDTKNVMPLVSKDEVTEALSHGALFTVRYAIDVLGSAVHLLRKPLSFLIFLWLLSFIILRLSNTLRTAFAPLCYVPGLSSSSLCTYPPTSRSGNPTWADYPKLIDVQSSTFEQLLDNSVGGSGLALEVKKAEMATADLVTLVRVSDLRSRDMLASSLTEFVEDARRASRGLQKLSSKVGGAVDSILAVNDYALHSIEAANAKADGRSYFAALLPFRSAKQPTSEVVTETFTDAMNILSANMQRLILEAETSLANLDRLEERLSTLHELVSREDSSISSAKSELLSELWTKLGGNRKALRGYNGHLYLLQNLGNYRKRALVHVVGALQTLTAMSEDMEDLRERVAAPELVGSRIPVEVHMKSIRSGLERLQEGRNKAKEREEEAMRRVLAISSEDVELD